MLVFFFVERSAQSLDVFGALVLFAIGSIVFVGAAVCGRFFYTLAREMWEHFDDNSHTWMPGYWSARWRNPKIFDALKRAVTTGQGLVSLFFVSIVLLIIFFFGWWAVKLYLYAAFPSPNNANVPVGFAWIGKTFLTSMAVLYFGGLLWIGWIFIDSWRSDLDRS